MAAAEREARRVQRSLRHGAVAGERVTVPRVRTPGDRTIRRLSYGRRGYEVTVERRFGYLPSLAGEHAGRVKATVARRMTAQLRRNRLWPVDTGLSKSLFGTRSTAEGWEIGNRAFSPRGFAYPQLINGARQIGGRRNRHYRAVQRWIERRWPVITGGLD